MNERTTTSTSDVVRRLTDATNRHDLGALADCFHPNYDSTFPAHPGRAFRGHGPMRQNWSRIFTAVPDIQSALVRSVSIQGTSWAEWEWSGTRLDGKPFLMRGVTIQGVTDGKIDWVRLYMEPVERTDVTVDAAIERTFGSQ